MKMVVISQHSNLSVDRLSLSNESIRDRDLDLDIVAFENKRELSFSSKDRKSLKEIYQSVNENSASELLNSVQTLLAKYKMYTRSMPPDSQVTSGGLQQLVTRKVQSQSNATNSLGNIHKQLKSLFSEKQQTQDHKHLDHEDEGICLFACLPVDLKLRIFSFLNAKSLCTCSRVCSEWNELSCDQLLWRRLLMRDQLKWMQISHLTNPTLHFDVQSELSNKEIYLKCSPQVRERLGQGRSTFNQISYVFNYLFPRKVPNIAMFGPGLEQTTSGIVRNMLAEDNGILTRVAMFPGNFDGVGGGMTFKLNSNHLFQLCVLYSASKQERENRTSQNRLQNNKLFQSMGSSDVYELKPQIKHLIQSINGFVFVIDASQSAESISNSQEELHAMISERKSTPFSPLLVVSCVQEQESRRLSAIEVSQLLDLSNVVQPWMVMDCESQTLHSLDKGLLWLIEQSQCN